MFERDDLAQAQIITCQYHFSFMKIFGIDLDCLSEWQGILERVADFCNRIGKASFALSDINAYSPDLHCQDENNSYVSVPIEFIVSFDTHYVVLQDEALDLTDEETVSDFVKRLMHTSRYRKILFKLGSITGLPLSGILTLAAEVSIQPALEKRMRLNVPYARIVGIPAGVKRLKLDSVVAFAEKHNYSDSCAEDAFKNNLNQGKACIHNLIQEYSSRYIIPPKSGGLKGMGTFFATLNKVMNKGYTIKGVRLGNIASGEVYFDIDVVAWSMLVYGNSHKDCIHYIKSQTNFYDMSEFICKTVSSVDCDVSKAGLIKAHEEWGIPEISVDDLDNMDYFDGGEIE